MATATRRIGPADRGRRISYEEFVEADFAEGWLYELARGIIVVTNVPHPDHGEIVDRVTDLFGFDRRDHPGIIRYRAAGSDCRLRMPGLRSDRHPDQAVYLNPRPEGEGVWSRWIPGIVVEVVSRGSKRRDYVQKRAEYLRMGVLEYWILDPKERRMLAPSRDGDTWREVSVPVGELYRTHLLPGLKVRPAELLGGPGPY